MRGPKKGQPQGPEMFFNGRFDGGEAIVSVNAKLIWINIYFNIRYRLGFVAWLLSRICHNVCIYRIFVL